MITNTFLSKIITDDIFRRHSDFDLAPFDNRDWKLKDVPSIRVLREETFLTLKSRAIREFRIPWDSAQFWIVRIGKGRAIRPSNLIYEGDPELSE